MATKKNAAAAAMDNLTNDRPSPPLTDEENLTAEEQQIMEAGNVDITPAEEPQEPQQEPAAEAEQAPPEEAAEGEENELAEEEVKARGPVLYQALREARQRQKELKKRLEAIEAERKQEREKWERVNERLLALQERQAQRLVEQQAQPPADPEPDKDSDYPGWLEWKIRQQENTLNQVATQIRGTSAMTEAARAQQMIDAMERQFMANGHPDYYDRISFLQNRRDGELQRMGYSDPAERAQIIATDAMRIVNNALKIGRNPAEILFELSNDWGFQPKVVNGNGTPTQQAAAPAAAAPAAPSGAQRIAQQQKRQAAASSATALRGLPPEGPVTMEDLAKMTDAEYEKYAAKLAKQGIDLSDILAGNV